MSSGNSSSDDGQVDVADDTASTFTEESSPRNSPSIGDDTETLASTTAGDRDTKDYVEVLNQRFLSVTRTMEEQGRRHALAIEEQGRRHAKEMAEMHSMVSALLAASKPAATPVSRATDLRDDVDGDHRPITGSGEHAPSPVRSSHDDVLGTSVRSAACTDNDENGSTLIGSHASSIDVMARHTPHAHTCTTSSDDEGEGVGNSFLSDGRSDDHKFGSGPFSPIAQSSPKPTAVGDADVTAVDHLATIFAQTLSNAMASVNLNTSSSSSSRNYSSSASKTHLFDQSALHKLVSDTEDVKLTPGSRASLHTHFNASQSTVDACIQLERFKKHIQLRSTWPSSSYRHLLIDLKFIEGGSEIPEPIIGVDGVERDSPHVQRFLADKALFHVLMNLTKSCAKDRGYALQEAGCEGTTSGRVFWTVIVKKAAGDGNAHEVRKALRAKIEKFTALNHATFSESVQELRALIDMLRSMGHDLHDDEYYQIVRSAYRQCGVACIETNITMSIGDPNATKNPHVLIANMRTLFDGDRNANMMAWQEAYKKLHPPKQKKIVGATTPAANKSPANNKGGNGGGRSGGGGRRFRRPSPAELKSVPCIICLGDHNATNCINPHHTNCSKCSEPYAKGEDHALSCTRMGEPPTDRDRWYRTRMAEIEKLDADRVYRNANNHLRAKPGGKVIPIKRSSLPASLRGSAHKFGAVDDDGKRVCALVVGSVQPGDSSSPRFSHTDKDGSLVFNVDGVRAIGIAVDGMNTWRTIIIQPELFKPDTLAPLTSSGVGVDGQPLPCTHTAEVDFEVMTCDDDGTITGTTPFAPLITDGRAVVGDNIVASLVTEHELRSNDYHRHTEFNTNDAPAARFWKSPTVGKPNLHIELHDRALYLLVPIKETTTTAETVAIITEVDEATGDRAAEGVSLADVGEEIVSDDDLNDDHVATPDPHPCEDAAPLRDVPPSSPARNDDSVTAVSVSDDPVIQVSSLSDRASSAVIITDEDEATDDRAAEGVSLADMRVEAVSDNSTDNDHVATPDPHPCEDAVPLRDVPPSSPARNDDSVNAVSVGDDPFLPISSLSDRIPSAFDDFSPESFLRGIIDHDPDFAIVVETFATLRRSGLSASQALEKLSDGHRSAWQSAKAQLTSTLSNVAAQMNALDLPQVKEIIRTIVDRATDEADLDDALRNTVVGGVQVGTLMSALNCSERRIRRTNKYGNFATVLPLPESATPTAEEVLSGSKRSKRGRKRVIRREGLGHSWVGDVRTASEPQHDGNQHLLVMTSCDVDSDGRPLGFELPFSMKKKSDLRGALLRFYHEIDKMNAMRKENRKLEQLAREQAIANKKTPIPHVPDEDLDIVVRRIRLDGCPSLSSTAGDDFHLKRGVDVTVGVPSESWMQAKVEVPIFKGLIRAICSTLTADVGPQFNISAQVYYHTQSVYLTHGGATLSPYRYFLLERADVKTFFPFLQLVAVPKRSNVRRSKTSKPWTVAAFFNRIHSFHTGTRNFTATVINPHTKRVRRENNIRTLPPTNFFGRNQHIYYGHAQRTLKLDYQGRPIANWEQYASTSDKNRHAQVQFHMAHLVDAIQQILPKEGLLNESSAPDNKKEISTSPFQGHRTLYERPDGTTSSCPWDLAFVEEGEVTDVNKNNDPPSEPEGVDSVVSSASTNAADVVDHTDASAASTDASTHVDTTDKAYSSSAGVCVSGGGNRINNDTDVGGADSPVRNSPSNSALGRRADEFNHTLTRSRSSIVDAANGAKNQDAGPSTEDTTANKVYSSSTGVRVSSGGYCINNDTDVGGAESPVRDSSSNSAPGGPADKDGRTLTRSRSRAINTASNEVDDNRSPEAEGVSTQTTPSESKEAAGSKPMSPAKLKRVRFDTASDNVDRSPEAEGVSTQTAPSESKEAAPSKLMSPMKLGRVMRRTRHYRAPKRPSRYAVGAIREQMNRRQFLLDVQCLDKEMKRLAKSELPDEDISRYISALFPAIEHAESEEPRLDLDEIEDDLCDWSTCSKEDIEEDPQEREHMVAQVSEIMDSLHNSDDPLMQRLARAMPARPECEEFDWSKIKTSEVVTPRNLWDLTKNKEKFGKYHAAWMRSVWDEVMGVIARQGVRALNFAERRNLANNESELPLLHSTMAFKVKPTSDGFVSSLKSRWCVKGNEQTTMDIPSSFAPTCDSSLLRVLLHFTATRQNYELRSIDFKQAFTQGFLKNKILIETPHIYRKALGRLAVLVRSLYGLLESARIFHLLVKEFLIHDGWKQSEHDEATFTKVTEDGIQVLIAHVDDLVIAGVPRQNDAFLARLSDKFDFTDFKEAKDFLGMTIVRSKGKIFIHQRRLIDEIIAKCKKRREANNINITSKVVDTPLPPSFVPTKDDGPMHAHRAQLLARGEKKDAVPFVPTSEQIARKEFFRSVVGMGGYLRMTRADVEQAISALGSYCADPGPEHEHALHHLARYLEHSREQCLSFDKDSSDEVLIYTDAGWGSCLDTRRSRRGYLIFLGSNLIMWSSKLMSTVALSTAESEYCGAFDAVKEFISLRRFLVEIGIIKNPNTPTRVLCDNKAAIQIANGQASTRNVRHMQIRYFALRDWCQDNLVDVEWVASADQLADIMTKAQPRNLFLQQRQHLVDELPPSLRG